MKTKIIGTFVLISLLVGLTSVLSYVYLKRIDASYSGLLNGGSAILQRASEIESGTQLQNSLLFSYLVDPSKEKEQLLQAANAKLSTQIADILPLAQSEDEQNEMKALGDTNDTFARLVKKVTDYMGKNEAGLAKSEALLWAVPLTDTLTKSAAAIKAGENERMSAALAANSKLIASTVRMLIGTSAAALAIALAIGFLLSRIIVRPLRSLVSAAGRIAACDLTVEDIRVKSRDELRELAYAFNRMKENLHDIISRAAHASEQVAAAAEELGANSGQLSESSEHIGSIMQTISEGSEAQVKSVNACVTMMEEMSSAVERIVELTQTADRKSSQALEAAFAGNEAIGTAIAQMSSIQAKMEDLAESVQRLGSRSEQIVKANDAIAQIARQTNLLALNASIEAARAGMEGRGFAVVAAEVRKLSLQTSAAAEEIDRLIGGIREETSGVVASTEAGAKEVSTGIGVVDQAGEAFRHIRRAVEDTARQIGLVTEQSRQIAEQSKSAAAAVRCIDDVAEQAAAGTMDVSAHVEEQYASMEEIVSSAALLTSMAEELQSRIGRFRV